ncbi:hypothetical protein SAMN05192588_1586 [Nonlabens sp. Hel1_33_55]|uniref:hypothetical protein n=1 Tax=Nonlabens sp. Hel1_33_55 TaxID=1336802 RepID=UPI000875E4D3|nr:hypothetical protein [Nonlabens sp. Hel1_33_55]SCY18974.1 hypothetical protein SAMN05192588_1586 [Nonlabens sp. Hel1_33_55]
MSTTEIKSMKYESFMNRAHRLDRRIRRPSKAEFQNLVRLENKNENYSKLLDGLKERMEKACEIFLNQDPPYDEQERLNVLRSLIAQAKSSEGIYECAARGLVMTERFK